jgi:hypothetical protein
MSNLILIPTICSFCAIVALPRRSPPADGSAVPASRRHVGWQHILALLALFMAAVLLLVLLATVPLRSGINAPTATPCWLSAPDDLAPCGPAQQEDAW